MTKHPVFSMMLFLTFITLTNIVLCGAVTSIDGGKLLDMESNKEHGVNITTRLDKNNHLLYKLIKIMERRGVRSIPETTMVLDDDHQISINRQEARQRTRRSSPETLFDVNKHIKRHNGSELIICERVICYNATQVKPCEVNFTADICIPCPPGTYIYDITKSNVRVLECLPKHHCRDWPGTVHSTEMHTCIGNHRMPCRCNTADHICGLDPCNCRKRWCRHDEVLLQNCTCSPLVRPVTVQATTSKTAVFVTEPAQSMEPSRPDSQPSPDIKPSTTKNKDRIMDGSVTTTTPPSPPVIHKNIVYEYDVGKTVAIVIVNDVIVLAVIAIGIAIYCLRQKILDCLPKCVSDRPSECRPVSGRG